MALSLCDVLPESIKEKDSIQSFRASLNTLLYLGRIVDATVRDVRLRWCVCSVKYVAINTLTLYIFTFNYYA